MGDHVDHAVFEQIFGALKAVRQLFANGLFDHALAGKADGRLKSTPFVSTDGVGPIRHAIEMRNASFDAPEVNALLAEHNVARVIADTREAVPTTLCEA